MRSGSGSRSSSKSSGRRLTRRTRPKSEFQQKLESNPWYWFVITNIIATLISSQVFDFAIENIELTPKETRLVNFDTTRASELVFYHSPAESNPPEILLFKNEPPVNRIYETTIEDTIEVAYKNHQFWARGLNPDSKVTIHWNLTYPISLYVIKGNGNFLKWKAGKKTHRHHEKLKFAEGNFQWVVNEFDDYYFALENKNRSLPKVRGSVKISVIATLHDLSSSIVSLDDFFREYVPADKDRKVRCKFPFDIEQSMFRDKPVILIHNPDDKNCFISYKLTPKFHSIKLGIAVTVVLWLLGLVVFACKQFLVRKRTIQEFESTESDEPYIPPVKRKKTIKRE